MGPLGGPQGMLSLNCSVALGARMPGMPDMTSTNVQGPERPKPLRANLK